MYHFKENPPDIPILYKTFQKYFDFAALQAIFAKWAHIGNVDKNKTRRKQTRRDISHFKSLRAGELENIICFAKYFNFAKIRAKFIRLSLEL